MNTQKARWMLAGLALVASVWLMSAGVKMGWLAAAFPVIGSMLLLVTAVLLVAPDTAVKIAEWIAKPFADLFYPSDEFEKPPLSYLLARRYSQERRVDAAVQEYEKILFYYPEERDAYLELIELAQRVGDEELREKYEGLLRKREEAQSSRSQEEGDH
jgi:cell division protein FtsW (lipid II flippase)